MREENIAVIRAACIKANPDIEVEYGCGHAGCNDYEIKSREVRLADMLLAIGASKKTHWKLYPSYDKNAHLVFSDFYNIGRWNLRTDDLTAQNDVCLEFLAGLLK